MKVYKNILAGLALAFALFGCVNPVDPDPVEEFIDVKMVDAVNLPRSIDVVRDATVLVQGKGFQSGDLLRFAASQTESFDTPVLNPGYSEFTFRVGSEFVSGTTFTVYLIREKQRQKLGITTIYVSEISDKCTVSGTVKCGTTPVKGVWVTDGKAWAKTDAEGKYYLNSVKKNGYVYIEIPSGYMATSSDAFPGYWQPLTAAVSELEYHNFVLEKVDNQNHRIVFTADWHLSNSWNPKDVVQVEAYLAEMRSMKQTVPTYSIPLGDLSWDIRWYSNSFDIVSWRNMMKTFPMRIFPVIGNHDYDFKGLDDFECSKAWRQCMGPTYYSFNLGRVHYVMVNDMIYTSDGKGTRDVAETIPDTELVWLKEDLSHVDKNTPIVVCSHVPMHMWTWNGSSWVCTERGTNFSEYLKLLKEYSLVHIFAGHSHIGEFFDVKAAGLAPNSMYEHKLPALGGTIWYTTDVGDFNISVDGISDGYEIMDVEGTSLSCRFKAVGEADDYNMRVYQLSQVKSYWETDGKMRNLVQSHPEYSFSTLYGAYKTTDVLINLFEASPVMKGTTIQVYEGTKSLPVKSAPVMDPLHLAQSEASAWAKSGALPPAAFQSKAVSHIFYVSPSATATSLRISFTGVNGKTIEKTVTLPKQFKNEDKF